LSAAPASQRPARGRLTLALWVLGLLLCVAVIARTPFNADLSAFLPASPDARQQLLMDQLQSGAIARTLFVGIEGGDAKQRAAASRALATALRASGKFEQVNNGDRSGADGAGPGNEWQASGEWIFRHRYQLSPAVGPERFSVAGLREGIDESLSLLGTPAGSALKPLLERDPTGETTRIVEALLPSSGPRSEEGVWAGREVEGSPPRALLLLSTRAAGGDIDGQLAAIEQVRSSFAPLAAQGLAMQISGPGVFAVESRSRIEGEARSLAITGSVVITGLLLLAFASLRALFVAAIPVATGVLCGIAAVGLMFGSVHGMTLGFGSTLIGEAVDYAIYYLIQARTGGAAAAMPGSGWRRWRAANWPTVRLGLWTSVCGFAVLMLSGFTGLAQLGVYSTAGLIGAALATRYVLPVLMPDGATGEGLRRPLGRFTGWLLRAMRQLRHVWLGLGIAAIVLLAWRGSDVWNANLTSLSPIPRAAVELDASLRADLTAGEARTLVVASGADLQAALRAAEGAGRLLDPLVADGTLAGYDSPARLLPSIETQRARLASLPEADVLRERVAEATADGPLPASRLGPFIDEVQAARKLAPIERADLRGSAVEPLLDALLVERSAQRGGGWSALISLQPGAKPIEGEVAARLQRTLDTQPGLQVIDIGRELRGLYDRYLHEALVQSLVGAAAVVLLLAWHLRSARRLLAVVQPLVLAVVLTLGGLVALGVELGILHLVGLLLVVAVGSNYALFFDQAQHEGQADAMDARTHQDVMASLALANLTMVVSFGLIAISAIPALSAIGRVVAPGVLLAMLLSAAFAHPVRRAGD